MRVHVTLHGGLRQIAGRREADLDLALASSVSAAVEALGLPLDAVGLAVVNGEVASLETALSDGDELDVFSPVAGG